MKTLLSVLLVTATLASPAFARPVDGPLASKLKISLEDVGAKVQMGANKRIISVSGVRCSTMLVREGTFGTCEMQDEVSGRVLRVSDRGHRGEKREVAELIKAMEMAGAKSEHRMGGSSTEARSIECETSFKMRNVRTTCNLHR